MKSCILFCFVIIATFVSCKQRQVEHEGHLQAKAETYTCPMHPEIIRSKPGNCPVCGMQLIKKSTNDAAIYNVDLNTLLRPTNSFVISTIPLTAITQTEQPIEIDAPGTITYDRNQTRTISARVSGRIEKLYVKFRYQKISKGQRIMDIYSPELMTQQNNLLFLIKNDPSNTSLISSAKQRLLFLGLTESQIQRIIKSGKVFYSLPVLSIYSGHLHESRANNEIAQPMSNEMANVPATTEALSLREGMYIDKGMTIFTIYDPSKAWALLHIYADRQASVKVGDAVKIIPETNPSNSFRATVSFIEPFFRPETKTLTVRVAFNNSVRQLPVGSKVRAVIYGHTKNAFWLPRESVVSLGIETIVFVKLDNGFKAHKVKTGLSGETNIQIFEGLSPHDSVALNAQYLIDSEGFIKTNNE